MFLALPFETVKMLQQSSISRAVSGKLENKKLYFMRLKFKFLN